MLDADTVKQDFQELRALVEQVAKNGAAETKSLGDQLRAKLGELEAKDLEAELKSLEAELKAANARIDQLEAEDSANLVPESKSWADFVHDSDAWRQNWSQKSFGSVGQTGRASTPSILFDDPLLFPEYVAQKKARDPQYKAAPTIHNSTLLAGMTVPRYRQDVVEARERRLGLLAALTIVDGAGTDTYSFTRETSKGRRGYWHGTITGDTAAGSASLDFDTVDGLVIGAPLRIHSTDVVGEGTYLVYVESISTLTVTFMDADGVSITTPAAVDDGDSVTSEVFGATAESGDKPYTLLETERITKTMKTIAVLAAITQQRLNSIPMLQSWAERKMRSRFRQVLSWHLLYGDGTQSDQLDGYFTQSDAGTTLWSEGAAGDNRVDAILRAIEELEAEGYFGAEIVMNPRDWGKIKRLKTEDGSYLFRRGGDEVMVDATARTIDGYQVRLDEVMKQGDFLVADFAESSEYVDQRTAAFALGYVNDQFRKNEITGRYEETGLHAILTSFAYRLGQWDSKPAAA